MLLALLVMLPLRRITAGPWAFKMRAAGTNVEQLAICRVARKRRLVPIRPLPPHPPYCVAVFYTSICARHHRGFCSDKLTLLPSSHFRKRAASPLGSPRRPSPPMSAMFDNYEREFKNISNTINAKINLLPNTSGGAYAAAQRSCSLLQPARFSSFRPADRSTHLLPGYSMHRRKVEGRSHRGQGAERG